jgi:glycosyltransferase involved in cell wall biosynthesis
MPDVRPRVLAIVPSFYPSTIVGVVKPLQRLHQLGRIDLDITVQYLARRRAIAGAEVVVMCGEALPPAARILRWVAELGRKLVFELDDNRLQVPADEPGLQYARHPAQQQLIIDCIRMADVVRVYSPHLQQLLRPYSSNVMLVDGPLDWQLVDTRVPPPRSTIKIVYATSRLQDRVGARLIEPLRGVLSRYPQAELTIWGGTLNELAIHPQVHHRPFQRNYDQFFKQFSGEHFDIGLAPLPDEDFHRGKSNNKFREYAACGIAGVYSDMPVYNTCVVDGDTGLLVRDDPEEWFTAISRLVEDASLRRQVGERARAFARRHYNDAVTGQAWMTALSAARPLASRPALAHAGDTTAPPSGGLLSKVAASVIDQGPGATLRRLGDHAASIAQILSWRLRRSSHAR